MDKEKKKDWRKEIKVCIELKLDTEEFDKQLRLCGDLLSGVSLSEWLERNFKYHVYTGPIPERSLTQIEREVQNEIKRWKEEVLRQHMVETGMMQDLISEDVEKALSVVNEVGPIHDVRVFLGGKHK